MLIELLSTSNYSQFNIKVAHIIGLTSAVYLNELMNINEKAIRKNKVTNECFVIDRKYIQSRTTLKEEEQLEIEANLLKIGVLQKDETNPDVISLDITALTTILMEPDETLIKNIKDIVKTSKTTTKLSKAESVKNNLKKAIVTDNEELREAYCEWIDSAYEKNGKLTKAAVVSAQQVVDGFAQGYLDVALKLIQIATIHGHREMMWAIDAYKRDYKINFLKPQITPAQTVPVQNEVKLSGEVF
jgi:hypothetical protein